MAPFQCDYGSQIHIGPRSFINFGAVVLDEAEVRIGADVQIGPNVQLITALHPLNTEDRRSGTESAASVTIADGAWLAAGVIVPPGVTVGADAVVGAGQRRHHATCPRAAVRRQPMPADPPSADR